MLRELEFEENPTRKDDIRACRFCDLQLPHYPDGIFAMPMKHDAPCGLPCLAGGVPVDVSFHDDRCPICSAL